MNDKSCDDENHENIYIMKTVNVERDWLIN